MENGFYALNGKGETVFFCESFELMGEEIIECVEEESDPYYEERYCSTYETARIDPHEVPVF